LEGGREAVIYRGVALRRLAASHDGRFLGVADDESLVILNADGSEKRRVPFTGITEMDWGRELVAGRGPELWRIPVDGGGPVKLDAPGNRSPGFSLHPDGKRIALTAGRTQSEVRVMKLPAL
jgi:hypothetical protein